MAESMAPAPTHEPNDKMLVAYKEWAEGGWGMLLTGNYTILICKEIARLIIYLGNVQVSETYLGGPLDVLSSKAASSDVQRIWKEWASTCQENGTPAVVQLNHPGRQSPLGAGQRGFFTKTLAPSAVKLNFGNSILAGVASSLLFGTPKAMTEEDISLVIDQFVAGAKQSFQAGFKGVELHGAHGYLLAQFLSPKTNLRTDDFGGSPAKRAEIVLRIIHQVRQATSKGFCIGIKLNSVDASSSDSMADTMEQIGLIVEAGIDFLEISGGTYEDPKMAQQKEPEIVTSTKEIKQTTLQRESFFLSFAQTIRANFPKVVLIVSGGFRTRLGMEAALQSGGCDLIGIARPATVLPKLPKEIILNEDIKDEDARVSLKPVRLPKLYGYLNWLLPVKSMGAGYTSVYYAGQIQRMGDGLKPLDTRL
jgi:2,4-dienoyl-CoA reductase-like NADH-dependent reductase (Old Yellow Enzyme family)